MRRVPIGCTAVSGTECGRRFDGVEASSSDAFVDAHRRDRRGWSPRARPPRGAAARKRRAPWRAARGPAPSSRSRSDRAGPRRRASTLAARLVVDHGREHGEVRVARACAAMCAAPKPGSVDSGADRVREGRHDPDAVVAPVLVRQVLACTRRSAGCRHAAHVPSKSPATTPPGWMRRPSSELPSDPGARCGARAPPCPTALAARHDDARPYVDRPADSAVGVERDRRGPPCTRPPSWIDAHGLARRRRRARPRRCACGRRSSAAFCFASYAQPSSQKPLAGSRRGCARARRRASRALCSRRARSSLFVFRIDAGIAATRGDRARSVSNAARMSATPAPATPYLRAQRSRIASGVRLQRFVLWTVLPPTPRPWRTRMAMSLRRPPARVLEEARQHLVFALVKSATSSAPPPPAPTTFERPRAPARGARRAARAGAR